MKEHGSQRRRGLRCAASRFGRFDQTCNSGRVGETRRPTVVRDLRSPCGRPRHEPHEAGDLQAPGGAGEGRSRGRSLGGPHEVAFQQTVGTLALAQRVVEQAQAERRSRMRIVVTSVFVEDQEKALCFYTEVLDFQKKTDVPVGEYRWLTVVSPEEPNGVELLLEPSEHPAVKPFKQALVEDGIPFTSFGVEDVEAEHARLEGLGVKFTQPPTAFGDVTTAVFDDTCGNLIQIAQT